MKIYLASRSPRRRKILEELGIDFEVVEPLWESKILGDDPGVVAELTALEKARSVMGWVSEGIVLGADTIVVANDGEILGKPRSVEEAKNFLRKLSGTWHRVVTGLALIKQPGRIEITGHEETLVKFRELDAWEIECYAKMGESMDKAGGYAIQGKAKIFVEEIRGDYYNVVGLPINLLKKLFKKLGIDLVKQVLRCEY